MVKTLDRLSFSLDEFTLGSEMEPVRGVLMDLDEDRFGIGCEVDEDGSSVYLAISSAVGNWVMVCMDFDAGEESNYLGSSFVVRKFDHELITSIDYESGWRGESETFDFKLYSELSMSALFLERSGVMSDARENMMKDRVSYIQNLLKLACNDILGSPQSMSKDPLKALREFIGKVDVSNLLKEGRRSAGKEYTWDDFLNTPRSFRLDDSCEAIARAYVGCEVDDEFMLNCFFKTTLGSQKFQPYKRELLEFMNLEVVLSMFSLVNKEIEFDGGVLRVNVKDGFKYLSFEDKNQSVVDVNDLMEVNMKQGNIYREFLERVVSYSK